MLLSRLALVLALSVGERPDVPARAAMAKSSAQTPKLAGQEAREASAERTDEALVAAARRGEQPAFGALYQRYRAAVHAVILARAPARDAGDLVQDVFVTALRRLSTLREDSAFAGWLMAIARNAATDHLRRTRRHVALPDELPSGQASGGARAEAARALAAIRSLPEAYRETLLMRLLAGMTGREIAERTGLEPGSVRVNLHRGMKLLRQRMEAGS